MTKKLLPMLLAITLILTGCRSSGSKVKENNQRLEELVQEFINDLTNRYLPLKDTPTEYARQPLAVSTKSGSYNIGLLQSFAEKQIKGEDCSITMAFTTTSTVFSRLVYEDGVGYYMRYQFDEKKQAEPLAIASRYFTQTKFAVNETASSATLTLLSGKNTEVASFSFKDIVTSTRVDAETSGK